MAGLDATTIDKINSLAAQLRKTGLCSSAADAQERAKAIILGTRPVKKPEQIEEEKQSG